MAKYQSIVKISGALDNYVFYELNGVQVMRKKSGFNKEAYNSNPKYQKVRENSNEFGHSSKSGKAIREALAEFLKESGDKYLYQKFAKLMTEIKDLDTTSGRGKRKVQVGMKQSAAHQMLRDFIFGEIENMNGIAEKSINLMDNSVSLIKTTTADQFIIITLKPNFENYMIKKHEDSSPIATGQKLFVFDKYFDDSEELLHFAVLKKNDKILNMGFV